jgi:hypothetical protein
MSLVLERAKPSALMQYGSEQFWTNIRLYDADE